MATKHQPYKGHTRFLFETLDTPQSDRVESTLLIDLRTHPRYDTRFPGELVAESGEHVYVTITNVSRFGLQLEGRRETLDAMLTELDLHSPDADSDTTLAVHFTVPTHTDRLVPVKVHAMARYTRRVEQDIYQFGMEFVTFDEGLAALVEYLSYRQATNARISRAGPSTG
jgi:hypothetical protein